MIGGRGMINYYRTYIAKLARVIVLVIIAVTAGKFALDASPSTAADSGCPYGYAMAHVIGRNYSTCAPVGSITSWGAVEPGAVISMPGTPWADPHAPMPYGDGGHSYYHYPYTTTAGYFGYPPYNTCSSYGNMCSSGYASGYSTPWYGYASYPNYNPPRYYY